jgi:hypothetical protein
VSEGNKQTTDEPRASEKNKKSLKHPLTNPTGCGTIKMSSREEHNNRRRKTPRNQKGIAL